MNVLLKEKGTLLLDIFDFFNESILKEAMSNGAAATQDSNAKNANWIYDKLKCDELGEFIECYVLESVVKS